MEIIERYQNGTEEIVIVKYSNGKFYIHYGWMEEYEHGLSYAGGFENLDAAEKALKKHRPKAERI